jgi:S1-C subfamily serine protease
MSAPRFILISDTLQLKALEIEGRPLVGEAAKIAAFFEKEGCSDLITLFAEPAPGGRADMGYKSVSWYTPLQGQAVGLIALDGEDRSQAEERLRISLEMVRPFLSHHEMGPVLRRALIIPSIDDVQILSGQAVLTNWGFAPSGILQDEDTLTRHWMSTLGPFASFVISNLGQPVRSVASAMSAPPTQMAPEGREILGDIHQATGEDAPNTANHVASRTAGASPAASIAKDGENDVTAYPHVIVTEKLPWYQVPPTWAVASAVLVGIGLLIGFFIWPWFSGRSSLTPEMANLLEMQKANNAGLEAEIDRLRQGLKGNVCTSTDPYLRGLPRSLPLAPLEGGGQVSPQGPGQAARSPDQETQGVSPQQQQALSSPGGLANTLEKSTVFVITDSGTGSAFFIGAKTLATNSHVVAGAKTGSIFVTSSALRKSYNAKVVATTGNDPNLDFAILMLEKDTDSAPEILKFAPNVEKLDPVYAAGYPGIGLMADPMFDRLRRGDNTAAPDLFLQPGFITAKHGENQGKLLHSATISQGNSGGPLVDACGRVVGINTLLYMDKREIQNFHQLNVALSGKSLSDFLRQNGVQPVESAGRCSTSTPVGRPG